MNNKVDNYIDNFYIKEFIIRTIKIIDIGYITFIYFILAFFISVNLDNLYGKFDKKNEDTKNTVLILLEIIAQIWFLGVIIYIFRNIVELIPYPLDGILGFDHKRVKELHTASIFSVILILFQKQLQEKLQYFYNRIISNSTNQTAIASPIRTTIF